MSMAEFDRFDLKLGAYINDLDLRLSEPIRVRVLAMTQSRLQRELPILLTVGRAHGVLGAAVCAAAAALEHAPCGVA